MQHVYSRDAYAKYINGNDSSLFHSLICKNNVIFFIIVGFGEYTRSVLPMVRQMISWWSRDI